METSGGDKKRVCPFRTEITFDYVQSANGELAVSRQVQTFPSCYLHNCPFWQYDEDKELFICTQTKEVQYDEV